MPSRKFSAAVLKHRREQAREYTRKYHKAGRHLLTKQPTKAQKLKYKKKWESKNPAKKAAQQKRTNEARRTIRLYGLTRSEVQQRLTDQGGTCALCPRELKYEGSRGAVIDHCHTTGQVRAVLCHHCNLMLGLARDDADLLIRAASYLKKYNAIAQPLMKNVEDNGAMLHPQLTLL